jgi:hypothetical protein
VENRTVQFSSDVVAIHIETWRPLREVVVLIVSFTTKLGCNPWFISVAIASRGNTTDCFHDFSLLQSMIHLGDNCRMDAAAISLNKFDSIEKELFGKKTPVVFSNAIDLQKSRFL